MYKDGIDSNGVIFVLSLMKRYHLLQDLLGEIYTHMWKC